MFIQDFKVSKSNDSLIVDISSFAFSNFLEIYHLSRPDGVAQI